MRYPTCERKRRGRGAEPTRPRYRGGVPGKALVDEFACGVPTRLTGFYKQRPTHRLSLLNIYNAPLSSSSSSLAHEEVQTTYSMPLCRRARPAEAPLRFNRRPESIVGGATAVPILHFQTQQPDSDKSCEWRCGVTRQSSRRRKAAARHNSSRSTRSRRRKY